MSKITILIIDDDLEDVRLLERVLSSAVNFSFLSANNLAAGCDMARQLTPDIVLLDLSLPDSRGLETVRHFARQFPYTPFIVITGFDDEEVGIEAIYQGAQDYIVKGKYDSDRLSRCIRYAIERHETYSQLKLVLATAQEAFVSFNSDGIITNWNPAAEKIFGWSAAEVLGKKLSEYIVPESYRSKYQSALQQFGETGRLKNLAAEMEFFALNHRGQSIPIEMTISPLRARNGIIFNTFIRDISERKAIEKRKDDEFIGTVSHELRTPLTAIKNVIANALHGVNGELDPQLRENLYIANSDIVRLAGLIDGLLDISKINAGKMTLNKTQVDVVALLQRVINSLQYKITEKKIDIKIQVDETLSKLWGDSDKIIQILTNLMDNAIKFTPNKGRVVVCIENQENQIQVSIEDNGIGIAIEDLDRIFKPFEKINHMDESEKKGAGLGLAIISKLITLHGGKIWARSEIGKGSQFFFTLPKERQTNEVSNS